MNWKSLTAYSCGVGLCLSAVWPILPQIVFVLAGVAVLVAFVSDVSAMFIWHERPAQETDAVLKYLRYRLWFVLVQMLLVYWLGVVPDRFLAACLVFIVGWSLVLVGFRQTVLRRAP